METKRYNKLALAGFIVGPVFIVLTLIAGFLSRDLAFALAYALFFPLLAAILVRSNTYFGKPFYEKGNLYGL